jgi:hypothetical protein
MLTEISCLITLAKVSCLFICDLFNDDVSSSDNIASGDRIINE